MCGFLQPVLLAIKGPVGRLLSLSQTSRFDLGRLAILTQFRQTTSQSGQNHPLLLSIREGFAGRL